MIETQFVDATGAPFDSELAALESNLLRVIADGYGVLPCPNKIREAINDLHEYAHRSPEDALAPLRAVLVHDETIARNLDGGSAECYDVAADGGRVVCRLWRGDLVGWQFETVSYSVDTQILKAVIATIDRLNARDGFAQKETTNG